MVVDIDGDDLWPPQGDAEEVIDLEDVKQDVLDGLTSVDMCKAIGDCLADWYLSTRREAVLVSVGDAIEVLPRKDRRKLHSFKMGSYGGIRQENVR
jgi:hypothetical protein